MVRDGRIETEEPDVESVLAALDDGDCRRIVRTLSEPMTADEICEACELPSSTAYRKLDLLSEAELLAEGTEIRSDGHHTTHYRRDFEAVRVRVEDRELTLEVARTEPDAADRLASLWGEVRRQT